MKKIIALNIILVSLIIFTGCNNKETNSSGLVINKYESATLNEDGDVVIDTTVLTSAITFINYKVDNVTVQLIAVRGSDEKVRIVFNSCQACNPDQNAYFIQDGDYIVCQTCRTRIKIDDIGENGSGCSPFIIPPEYQKKDGDYIIISADYIETFKNNFENWKGILA